MEPFDSSRLVWTREPSASLVSPARIEIVTKPHTDLWQRTYYHFRNDTAPVLQMTTGEQYFSFIVKTEFDSKVRFDQCGVALYLDSENWLKASIEYEDGVIQHLGSVVTNHGYSDRDPRRRQIHVVPAEPPGQRFPHRLCIGRRNLAPDAHLPPVGGRRPGVLRRLCRQPGELLLQGSVHPNAADRMPVEGSRRPAAGRGLLGLSLCRLTNPVPAGILLEDTAQSQ